MYGISISSQFKSINYYCGLIRSATAAISIKTAHLTSGLMQNHFAFLLFVSVCCFLLHSVQGQRQTSLQIDTARAGKKKKSLPHNVSIIFFNTTSLLVKNSQYFWYCSWILSSVPLFGTSAPSEHRIQHNSSFWFGPSQCRKYLVLFVCAPCSWYLFGGGYLPKLFDNQRFWAGNPNHRGQLHRTT